MGPIERARVLRQLDLDDLLPLAPKKLEIAPLVQITLVRHKLRKRLAMMRLLAASERYLE
jgi:hypothetical protein